MYYILYTSCFPSIQTRFVGLQTFSSQDLSPMLSEIWALTSHTAVPDLPMNMQSGVCASFVSAMRGQTIPDSPCNESSNLALKVSYYNADLSYHLQGICIVSVNFCEMSTSHLMAASCLPILAAWESFAVLLSHSPENSRNYCQN